MNDQKLLTTEEAAQVLGDLGVRTTPGTLKFWRHAKRGPPYLKIGNAVRYRRADLDAYVDTQLIEPSGF